MTAFATRLRTRARTLATGGTASIVGGALAQNVLRIVSSMTLTRMLSAEAFGVVGILASAAFVVLMVADAGFYAFVMRHERHDAEFLDEVWTLRLIRAVALALTMVALSWPLAHFLQKPDLQPAIAAWGAIFLIEGFSSMSFVSGVRQQMLWRLTWMEIANAVLQLACSIALALVLHSYWALILSSLTTECLRTLLSYRMFPGSGRRLRFSRLRARELWTFSRYIALSSILTVLILQSDKLILARLMPLSVYGLYAIATTLAIAPVLLGHQYASRILYPAYAAAAREAPGRLAAIFYAKRRWSNLGYMTAIGGMIGGAPLIVAILYDPRYLAASTYFQLVAISATLGIANQAAEEALISSGLPRWTLYANIVRVAWLLAGGSIALATHRYMLLVGIFGTVEIVAMLAYWVGLRRIGVLRLSEEALGFVAVAIGLASGWALARGVLATFPTL